MPELGPYAQKSWTWSKWNLDPPENMFSFALIKSFKFVSKIHQEWVYNLVPGLTFFVCTQTLVINKLHMIPGIHTDVSP